MKTINLNMESGVLTCAEGLSLHQTFFLCDMDMDADTESDLPYWEKVLTPDCPLAVLVADGDVLDYHVFPGYNVKVTTIGSEAA